MQVFKLCMKIIKKNMSVLLIYVFVFVTFSIIVSLSSGSRNKETDAFTVSKTSIAFLSGENTPLVNGLKE